MLPIFIILGALLGCFMGLRCADMTERDIKEIRNRTVTYELDTYNKGYLQGIKDSLNQRLEKL